MAGSAYPPLAVRQLLFTVGLIAVATSVFGALITGCGIFFLGTVSLEPPLPYASVDLSVGEPKEITVVVPKGNANAEVHNLLPYVSGGVIERSRSSRRTSSR